MKQKVDGILKSVFDFILPGEELDGGEFIQDTEIFKILSEQLEKNKPNQNKEIELLSFELAKKSLAIHFNLGSNYGSFTSDSFDHLFETQFEFVNIDDLVLLLNYYRIIYDFDSKVLNIDLDKLLVTNSKTGEIISFSNIERMTNSFLNMHLEIQIQKIITVLNFSENRNFWIDKLAGSKKEEYVESAIQKFDSLIGTT